MTTINQALIAQIAQKLGISVKAVYPHITKIVNDTGLERDVAALKLGAQHGVNLTKYSSAEQRAELRGQTRDRGDPTDGPSIPLPQPKRRSTKPTKKAKKSKGNTIFVVHGRDEALRKSMFDFLRSLNLHPLEWNHAIDAANEGNPNVGDMLNIVMEKAEAIVVLFTPDDQAQLKDQFVKSGERSSEGKLQAQARPNVLFEAGLALGAHPTKTIMVEVGKVKPFSDIGGKHMLKLSDSAQSRNSFINRLGRICAVDRIGNDWMTTGKFEATALKATKKKRA